MNSRLESLIKGSHPISGEEQNPGVVFHHPEKDRHDAVTVIVAFPSLSKENVGFIEQQHTVPFGG